MLDLAYKMLRLRTALMLLLFVAIGDAATKTNPNHFAWKLLLIGGVLGAWYIYSTSLNDIADVEIDQINLKGNSQRPLANHKASRRQIIYLAIAAGCMAVVLAAWISKLALVYTLAAILLGYTYSLEPVRISRRGILAPLLLPLAYVVYPILLTAQVNAGILDANFYLVLFSLYISFTARIILKDFRDIKGDKQYGKRTFIVRHGAVLTCRVSQVAWIIGFVGLCLRFRDSLLIPGMSLLLLVIILQALSILAKVKELKVQLQYIGLIGRLANGLGLILLVGIYSGLQHHSSTNVYPYIVILLTGFVLLTAWTLYEPVMRRLFSHT